MSLGEVWMWTEGPREAPQGAIISAGGGTGWSERGFFWVLDRLSQSSGQIGRVAPPAPPPCLMTQRVAARSYTKSLQRGLAQAAL